MLVVIYHVRDILHPAIRLEVKWAVIVNLAGKKIMIMIIIMIKIIIIVIIIKTYRYTKISFFADLFSRFQLIGIRIVHKARMLMAELNRL